jgi:hypothetical protein
VEWDRGVFIEEMKYMTKIFHNNKEYADKVNLESKIKIPFLYRLTFLFRNEMTIRHDIYVKYEMPPYDAEMHISIFSYMDQFRLWLSGLGKKKVAIDPQKYAAEVRNYIDELTKQGYTKIHIMKAVKRKYKVIIKL